MHTIDDLADHGTVVSASVTHIGEFNVADRFLAIFDENALEPLTEQPM
jgi:hypothetical protein